MAAELGIDLSCVTDIDPMGRESSGTRGLSEALARRLITPRGTLIGDPEYGLDVREWLSGHFDQRTGIPERQALVRDELLKDERVFSCSVQVSYDVLTRALSVKVDGTAAEGPFAFTLAVDAVTVAILQGG